MTARRSTTTGIVRPPDPDPVPPAPAWIRAAAWTVIAVAAAVSVAAAGYLVGLRSAEAEQVRTRAAYCLLLDHLGADPASAAEAYPCSTEPTR